MRYYGVNTQAQRTGLRIIPGRLPQNESHGCLRPVRIFPPLSFRATRTCFPKENPNVWTNDDMRVGAYAGHCAGSAETGIEPSLRWRDDERLPVEESWHRATKVCRIDANPEGRMAASGLTAGPSVFAPESALGSHLCVALPSAQVVICCSSSLMVRQRSSPKSVRLADATVPLRVCGRVQRRSHVPGR